MELRYRVVIVSGTRNHSRELVKKIARRLDYHRRATALEVLIVAQGRSPYGGADKIARIWCEMNGLLCVSFPASEESASGFKSRNTAMVEYGAAMKAAGHTVVVDAFPDVESRGTWDVVNKAKARGLDFEVHKVGAA